MNSGPADIQVSEAVSHHARALAQLHVEVWRETYRDLAPQEALEKLDEEARLPYWNSALDNDDPLVGALIVTKNNELAGVISFGRSMHPAMNNAIEIKHCYVKNRWRGHGFGKVLLNSALEHLRKLGAAQVSLAVVEQNLDARRFYRSMGGREVGSFIDPGPLWKSSNVVVLWDLDT